MSDPAYPHLAQAKDSYEAVQHHGLSKLELFSMAAMQGLLSNCGGPYQFSSQTGWTIVNCTQAQVAQECVSMAVELMAELEKYA